MGSRFLEYLGTNELLTLTFLALQAVHPVLVLRCDLRITDGTTALVTGKEPEGSIEIILAKP
jgi:hypothetical protein